MSTELHRPRVSAFLALSLDGFIAGEGGDLAWLEPYNGDSQEETGYSALMASADTLLMGRNSYDTVLAFPEWFYGDKPVVVLTHRPAAPREYVSFRQGALAQVLDELWLAGSRHLYLDGGEVVRQGLQAALVDELILFWVPVTLGRGVPLFAGPLPGALVPVSSRVLPSGLVRVVYQPA
ncbi:dihydrofolate reductase family protein [Aeromonas hydrophila]|uniref:dihydrofolate reductase family protein n=1 Tax=Aeromonas hydrophila TaxID=644 RepID=UPI000F52A107|nr:dihydrofolate reductase family protein [Aeromonas hydrophila]MBX9563663.1 dihydrofolate reductase [Aeromonas hydrophila]RQM71036.1 dihydrofolate reductase [Aeromonas hydrophila]